MKLAHTNTRLMRLVLLLGCMLLAIALTIVGARTHAPLDLCLSPDNLIAHALGGIEEHTYTNSREAFLANYTSGIRIFEVDLLTIQNDEVVAFHDLESTYGTFGILGHIKDLDQAKFKKSKYHGKYTPLSLEDVLDLIEEHPGTVLVLDFKDSNDNIQEQDLVHSTDEYARVFNLTMQRVLSRNATLIKRIVPQIYSEKDLTVVRQYKEIPYVIYTLYRTRASDPEVLSFIKQAPEIRLVATSKQRFSKALAKALREKGIESFVYTVNDLAEMSGFWEAGARGFYTDYIPPTCNLK